MKRNNGRVLVFRPVARISVWMAVISTIALIACPLASQGGSDSAASDIKIWPFFYHATDPVTDISRTEVLWPFYVNEQTANYSVHQFLSLPQRYPTFYSHQFYLGWPLSGLRFGEGRYDVWL
ncbi:MAG TPA: hypothetical protein VLA51_08745, partial [Paracoccaceae bacterium]|nr:hypothetical protein [Paracoccaceae bacterium]